jgi:hypothetical protein
LFAVSDVPHFFPNSMQFPINGMFVFSSIPQQTHGVSQETHLPSIFFVHGLHTHIHTLFFISQSVSHSVCQKPKDPNIKNKIQKNQTIFFPKLYIINYRL